jgi:DinB family protein
LSIAVGSNEPHFIQWEVEMKAVDFVRKSLDSSARGVLALIEDMKDAPFTFPTPKGGNHPLWVLGHLAWVEGNVIQQIMLGGSNPVAHWSSLFGIGSEASAEASRYPSFDEVHKAFRDIHGGTSKVLSTLNDDDLDRPSKNCPPEFKEFLGTYGGCFLVTIYNTMHHRGQVADARRAAGRKPLRM